MYICACAIVFYKLAVIGVENDLCLVVPVAMSTSALTLSLGKGGRTFKSGSPSTTSCLKEKASEVETAILIHDCIAGYRSSSGSRSSMECLG